MADILVIGSGVMGRGIAASFARGGAQTRILSRDPSRLADLPAGVTAIARLPEAPPDLIVESIPEQRELKIAAYRDVEAAYPAGVPLASNTSALDLEDLASALERPQCFLAIHYFMPADVTPLVEVAPVAATDPAIVPQAVKLLEQAGKRCIVLKRAVPGLLINRLQHAILHEAYQLIDQGVTSAADVDLVARELLGPRMSLTGLIEQKDLSGLDTHAWAQRALVPELGLSREPARCLQELFEHGHLGIKSGRGFYDWSRRDGQAYKAASARKLAQLLAYLDELRAQ
ncbi:MAG TPA: 3-hydroxyacyl-CoA dehydrogenase NAD-binding domain-containing protein [Pelomicrobium sp.]|nr:3-hydroxyacyl-CoA dehydrogenase NAD-binding domain-containing protein [Pelomicrobium sp.]